MRITARLFVLLLLSAAVWSQEANEQAAGDEPADAETTAEVEPDPEPAEEDEVADFDDTGLDEQGFSNEDDDFNPSEDIPADQSIEFPADI